MAQRSGSGLHRFAVATAGATFVLLFLGGLVTSTGSGLAVPDWLLSLGQVFPPRVGGVLFEHGHRLAATAVGCLTVVLALWTVLGDARTSVRALGLLALLGFGLASTTGRSRWSSSCGSRAQFPRNSARIEDPFAENQQSPIQAV